MSERIDSKNGKRIWAGLDREIWNTLDQEGPMDAKKLWKALGCLEALGCRDECKLVRTRLAHLRSWGRVERLAGRTWSAVPKARWPVEMPKAEPSYKMSEGERAALDEQRAWNERVLAERRERERMRGGMAAR